jgi:hypothetical protein
MFSPASMPPHRELLSALSGFTIGGTGPPIGKYGCRVPQSASFAGLIKNWYRGSGAL